MLLVPRPATAAISAGPTIDLPWMQYVNDFAAVTAAVLADGSFAIAGTEAFQPTPQEITERLQAQFFRASGAAQTPPVVLRPPGGVGAAGVGSVGSRYFLVWEGRGGAHAAFYSQQGALLGQPFPWPISDIPEFAAHYRFGDAPLWRFLPITFTSAGLFEGYPYYRTLLRAAQPNGHLLGSPVELAPQALTFFEDAAINGSGRFVVVSDQCSLADPGLPCIRGMQMFDGAVTPRTPLVSAEVPQDESPGGVGNSSVRAAIGAQGQVLLTWFTDEQLPVPRYVARLYDRDGSPASDEVPVVTPAVLDLSPIREVKALDDGSFVLSWLLYTQVDHMATLFVVRFDPQTKSFEEPVALAEGSMAGALLELNGAGRGVIVWQTEESNADGNVIAKEGHLRVIRVNR
ncbi:MAG TPA: hypothetical protein VHB47_15445 [Thermoanaerobaculia bacterium]|nr:hypothetical protein [Thermoanaerobaculia bacterium]